VKRKNEEEKLTKEKQEIIEKHKEIERLKEKLKERQGVLRESEDELKRHKIFTNFLE